MYAHIANRVHKMNTHTHIHNHFPELGHIDTSLIYILDTVMSLFQLYKIQKFLQVKGIIFLTCKEFFLQTNKNKVNKQHKSNNKTYYK